MEYLLSFFDPTAYTDEQIKAGAYYVLILIVALILTLKLMLPLLLNKKKLEELLVQSSALISENSVISGKIDEINLHVNEIESQRDGSDQASSNGSPDVGSIPAVDQSGITA